MSRCRAFDGNPDFESAVAGQAIELAALDLERYAVQQFGG
jgi:hypothetical protein